MAKIGRNEPCPCGSGNKYKRCCLPREEADAAARAVVAQRAAAERFAAVAAFVEQNDGLDEASNCVVDLIDAGHLDDAERAAHDLLRRYPEVVDGLERLAMVAAARGDRPQAATYYRKAADFLRDNPDGGDSEQWMRTKADQLDPPPPR